MGGSHSNSVSVVNDVLNESIQSSTQDCVKFAMSDNTAVIDGDHDMGVDITQSAVATIDGSCVAKLDQSDKFSNDVSSKIAQALKDEGVALTQWLDNTDTSNSTSMKTNISNIIMNSASQTCVNNAKSDNMVIIRGSGDIADRVDQTARASIVSNCLMGNGQSAASTNSIANSATQSSVTVSKNPMDFIGDALKAMVEAGTMGIAVLFIIIICFLFLTKFMRHHGSSTEDTNSNIGSEGSKSITSA